MRLRIRVEGSAWILFAVLLLLLPLNWVLASVVAAAVHEWFHLICLKLCRVPVHVLRIGGRGALLEAGPMEGWQELFCALAGPMGSLMLVLLIHVFPRTALCGLVQGLYNLIPLGESDGSRILKWAMGLHCGKKPCKQGKEGVQ